ncbi:hypothetical protein B4113_0495 [Geobacillus sp. B4113_201601]|nr:hypothetical protein B4113_0495 [Geobacillus sp. B4113_201601]
MFIIFQFGFFVNPFVPLFSDKMGGETSIQNSLKEWYHINSLNPLSTERR